MQAKSRVLHIGLAVNDAMRGKADFAQTRNERRRVSVLVTITRPQTAARLRAPATSSHNSCARRRSGGTRARVRPS